MKSLFLILPFIFVVFNTKAQNKLCYEVYYYNNPEHKIKIYKNILVFTNASLKTQTTLHKAAKYADFKITLYNEIFPPIKDYTDSEIAKGIEENNIDAILYYDILGTTSTKSDHTYGSYSINSFGFLSGSQYNKTKHYTSIKAVFVETSNINKKIFYCTGGANGKEIDVGYRVFNKMLESFEKIGVGAPPTVENSIKYSAAENSLENEFFVKGKKKYDEKDFSSSISAFDKTIELNPNFAEAYFYRARAKTALADYNGSTLDNNKAIELDPNFSMAYNNRGWNNYLLKNYIEALKDFNKAIEIDPRNDVAYDSRQETKFALNDFAGCMEDCNMAISLNPKLANSYFLRGKVYFKNGDKAKACENWSKAGQYGTMEAYELIKQNCN